MQPGDLVRLRGDLGDPSHRVVLIAEVEDDYIRVLMDGRLVWMPKSFVVRGVEALDPVRPAGGVI